MKIVDASLERGTMAGAKSVRGACLVVPANVHRGRRLLIVVGLTTSVGHCLPIHLSDNEWNLSFRNCLLIPNFSLLFI